MPNFTDTFLASSISDGAFPSVTTLRSFSRSVPPRLNFADLTQTFVPVYASIWCIAKGRSSRSPIVAAAIRMTTTMAKMTALRNHRFRFLCGLTGSAFNFSIPEPAAAPLPASS